MTKKQRGHSKAPEKPHASKLPMHIGLPVKDSRISRRAKRGWKRSRGAA